MALTYRFKSLAFLFIFLIFSTLTPSLSPAAESQTEPVHIEMISEETSIQPGRPFWLAFHLKMEEGWHSYWKNPGDTGMPIAIEWELPEGFNASPLVWPTPKHFSLENIIGYGYEGEALLLAKIVPPSSISSEKIPLKASVRWLVCSDSSCLPGQTSLELELPIQNLEPKNHPKHFDFFAQAKAKLPKKQEGIEAYRDTQELKLYLPMQSHSVNEVFFYPEKAGVVDHKKKAILSLEEDSYLVTFSNSSAGENASHLKGIIVLKGDQSDHAIEIDTPIQDFDASDLISMNDDPIDLKKVLQKNSPVMEPEFKGGLWMALGFAFLGGLLLNLMPCVLPVISIKIFSFVRMAGNSRLHTMKHGLAFGIGVLISFWVMAGILLILQTYGKSAGWGFQLQEPLFVGGLAAILFIFGLSLFGVFEFGNGVTNIAGKVQAKGASSHLTSSFFSGVLATAVATPCTGPFLGSAIGFAFTLPPIQALFIFTSLGLGMSFPYLVLSSFPNLLRFLPKPGPWMDTFKQLMGFFMMATILWLVWVFGAETGSLSISLLLFSFFCLAIGAWIYGKWGDPIRRRGVRLTSMTLTAACLLISSYAIYISTQPWVIALEESSSLAISSEAASYPWEEFSPERVAELQKQGTPVFVDFTAKWCLICQANHLVLTTSDVEDKMQDGGIVRMKADWTKNNPMITEQLRKYGRNGVPLYLLFPGRPNAQPKVLPQVLTGDTLRQALDDLTHG